MLARTHPGGRTPPLYLDCKIHHIDTPSGHSKSSQRKLSDTSRMWHCEDCERTNLRIAVKYIDFAHSQCCYVSLQVKLSFTSDSEVSTVPQKDNKLQRFLSRWKFMQLLDEHNILQRAKENGKKIHFLGMVDGPNEISLMRDFHIDTWDSSAGVWTGLNGIQLDLSLIHI